MPVSNPIKTEVTERYCARPCFQLRHKNTGVDGSAKDHVGSAGSYRRLPQVLPVSILELAYGLYCCIVHQPHRARPVGGAQTIVQIDEFISANVGRLTGGHA